MESHKYNCESTSKAILVDEKTFRQYVWKVIDSLSELDLISFEDRLLDAQPGQICFCSLDGVDFRVLEPTPFDKNFFSHKIKTAPLRYEIGIALRTGHIVWKFGGYPAGQYPDLKLARELCVHLVMPQELTIADKRYANNKYFITPHVTNRVGDEFICFRHESVNKRIRQFKVLYNTFRHGLAKHSKCFDAVVNITALVIKLEDPLSSILDT